MTEIGTEFIIVGIFFLGAMSMLCCALSYWLIYNNLKLIRMQNDYKNALIPLPCNVSCPHYNERIKTLLHGD